MTKVILVSGAGRGLGADIAREALAAGHRVVATGRRPEEVEKTLGGPQDNLLVTRLDVTSSDFPNYDRNHNTAADPNADAELRSAVQTVHFGGAQGSKLVLPLAGK